MTAAHDEQLATIFSDAEGLGHLDPKYAEVMHDRVMSLYIDLMLDLAAAQHEVQTLKAQRDATRQYLGVAISEDDDEDEELLGPEALLRKEVKRIIASVGIDKKIQCIKELRSSEVASKAWGQLGNGLQTGVMGNTHLGLKEAKDVIDAASGMDPRLYLGVKGFKEL